MESYYQQKALEQIQIKVKAVEKIEIPKNKGELRSILGLATYFSRFIQDYATIVEPLRELIRGKEVWIWTDRQMSALAEIKKRCQQKLWYIGDQM